MSFENNVTMVDNSVMRNYSYPHPLAAQVSAEAPTACSEWLHSETQGQGAIFGERKWNKQKSNLSVCC